MTELLSGINYYFLDEVRNTQYTEKFLFAIDHSSDAPYDETSSTDTRNHRTTAAGIHEEIEPAIRQHLAKKLPVLVERKNYLWSKTDWFYLYMAGPKNDRKVLRMRIEDTDPRLPADYRAMRLLGMI